MSRDANWIMKTLKNLSFSYQIAQKSILSIIFEKRVSIYACYFCFTCFENFIEFFFLIPHKQRQLYFMTASLCKIPFGYKQFCLKMKIL